MRKTSATLFILWGVVQLMVGIGGVSTFFSEGIGSRVELVAPSFRLRLLGHLERFAALARTLGRFLAGNHDAWHLQRWFHFRHRTARLRGMARCGS